VTVVYERR